MQELNLLPVKIYCSVLADDAIKAAWMTTRNPWNPKSQTNDKRCRAEDASGDSFAISPTESSTRKDAEINSKRSSERESAVMTKVRRVARRKSARAARRAKSLGSMPIP